MKEELKEHNSLPQIVKGNIPINYKLFNKYSNVTEIMSGLNNKLIKTYEIKLISELIDINLIKLNKNQISNLAIKE